MIFIIYIILIYANLLRLFCGLTYGLSWRILYVHLRKICLEPFTDLIFFFKLAIPADSENAEQQKHSFIDD